MAVRCGQKAIIFKRNDIVLMFAYIYFRSMNPK